ncbi:MAG: hypothetical protein ACRD2A_13335, partial [Vicinamibacterales bacterium]
MIIGNVKETIGAAFLPVVDEAATWLGNKLPGAVATAGTFFTTKLLPPLKAVAGFVKDKVIPVATGIVDSFAGMGGRIVRAIGKVDLADIADDIWTDASMWAGKLIGGLKTGVEKGDWKPLGAAVGNGLLGLIRGIDWGKLGGALGDAVVTLFQKTADLGVKIGTAFKAVIDKVDWKQIGRDSTAAIGQFIAGVDWGAVAKALGVMALKSLKINKSIYDSVIIAARDLVIGMTLAIIDEMEVQRLKLVDWTKRVGADLISGLWSGIKGAMSGIGGFIKGAIVDPIVGWAKSLFGVRSPSTVFAAIGTQLIAGLKGGITAAVRGIGTWIGKSVVSPVVGVFARSSTWLVQQGKNLVAGFKNGIWSVAKTIGSWVYNNVIKTSLAPFAHAAQWLVTAGSKIVRGLIGGVVAHLKALGGIGSWVYNNVIRASLAPFAKAGLWLVGHGRNIVGGLLGGIAEKMKGIGSWIKSTVVDPMVTAVKNFFGIRSPSRVFE